MHNADKVCTSDFFCISKHASMCNLKNEWCTGVNCEWKAQQTSIKKE